MIRAAAAAFLPVVVTVALVVGVAIGRRSARVPGACALADERPAPVLTSPPPETGPTGRATPPRLVRGVFSSLFSQSDEPPRGFDAVVVTSAPSECLDTCPPKVRVVGPPASGPTLDVVAASLDSLLDEVEGAAAGASDEFAA